VHKTVVICAVGLTPSLIDARTPRLKQLVERGRLATIDAVIPAVTCSVQSTYLTGAWPDGHGIVGNGWYFRDECEVKFWRQSNRLVQSPKVWDAAKARDPRFTCANLFWWYAMYSSADYTVTPRPMYPADGRKLPDVWTHPSELRDQLQRELGQFPLFKFWGPLTSIESTRWIADAAMHVDRKFDPTLTLIYLPHLDYNFQRYGPDDPRSAADVEDLDGEIGKLVDYFESRRAHVIVLSEYGITAVSRPVHINRALRQHGLIVTRDELGRELLDHGASDAFAVADHQVAHVYLNQTQRRHEVRSILQKIPGVGRVYEGGQRREVHLDHDRAGEFVVLAEPDAWFTYYYWLEDERAPDYARTVDIHRKPGYDPVELFLDPALRAPKLKVGWTLAKRNLLKMRALLDVIPLDATLVRGSHGLAPRDPKDGAMLVTSSRQMLDAERVSPVDVHDLILRHVFSA
jgi:predicted AlkP superfamily pyrophosphatase or phosphodiesterase